MSKLRRINSIAMTTTIIRMASIPIVTAKRDILTTRGAAVVMVPAGVETGITARAIGIVFVVVVLADELVVNADVVVVTVDVV